MKYIFGKIASALGAFLITLLSALVQMGKLLYALGCSGIIPLILMGVIYCIDGIFSIHIGENVYDILWTVVVFIIVVIFSYCAHFDVWNEKNEDFDSIFGIPTAHSCGLVIVAMLIAIIYIWDLGIVWDMEDGLKIFSK